VTGTFYKSGVASAAAAARSPSPMYPLLILCLEPTRFGVLLFSMSGDVPRGSREKTFEAAYCWFILSSLKARTA
jgi:hypothetical protein